MDYISLRQASKFCSYSQDYLKLRARQGKLRAMKIGRNWVTKKEWLEEYSGKIRMTPAKKFQFKLVFILLGIILGMTAISIILVETIIHPEVLNFTINVFRDYFQWLGNQILTASSGDIFQEFWEVIPERVIEINFD